MRAVLVAAALLVFGRRVRRRQRLAAANRVISPYTVGGWRMASQAIKRAGAMLFPTTDVKGHLALKKGT